MKNILLISCLVLLSTSCAKQSDVDCLSEKLEIMERYDNYIRLSSGDDIIRLQEEKKAQLALLDC